MLSTPCATHRRRYHETCLPAPVYLCLCLPACPCLPSFQPGKRLFHTYQLPFRNSDNRVDSYFLFAGENTELVSVANRGEVARENKRSREIAEPREEEEEEEEEDQVK